MTKTLGDYISHGHHEFVAFVRNMASLCDTNRDNYGTWGNDLGNIHMGILVCNRSESKQKAQFFHKEEPVYNGDSNIIFGNFDYSDAKVISEVPLSLELSSFWSGEHLKKGSKEFREAKALMKKYGIY